MAGVTAAACLALTLAWPLSAARPASGGGPLVVHEWGTFTALQDDDGSALGAINSDDEPVPDFVCRAGGVRPQTRSALSLLSPGLTGSKGIIACHPGVTMRLETPVIYFYPPQGGKIAPVDVRVTFHGGWLTEFYPRAKPVGINPRELPPGVDLLLGAYARLDSTTTDSLAWNGVGAAGATGDLTPTDDPVWTTPRAVPEAAVVTVTPPAGTGAGNDEYRPEKFLFYRGVGHLDAPLRAVRDVNTDRLSLYADPAALAAAGKGGATPDLRVSAAWLLEIRPEDGFCAFRPVVGTRAGPLDLGAAPGQPLATLPAHFAPGEFGAHRLEELRAAMAASLTGAGLSADEASAMLDTWELSYFKSPGRRLFFLTPPMWTEAVLPLTIEGAAITRVMIGRIELVTPAQRERLARLAAGPCPDLRAFSQAYHEAAYADHMRRIAEWEHHIPSEADTAKKRLNQLPTLEELKVPVPALYQDYLGLGRFRDALVLREQERRPTEALREFIAANGLR